MDFSEVDPELIALLADGESGERQLWTWCWFCTCRRNGIQFRN